MTRPAVLLACLALAGCGAQSKLASVEVIQAYYGCLRPTPPVYQHWDRNQSLCSPANINATLYNWIDARQYQEALESCVDCYERQANGTAKPTADD